MSIYNHMTLGVWRRLCTKKFTLTFVYETIEYCVNFQIFTLKIVTNRKLTDVGLEPTTDALLAQHSATELISIVTNENQIEYLVQFAK